MIRSLSDRRSFDAFRNATNVRQGVVGVRFVGLGERSGSSATAVAFALSRRVGSAVVRNRIRRRLRAALRELAQSNRLPGGALLISATSAAAKRAFPDLRADLHSAITRAAARASAPQSSTLQ